MLTETIILADGSFPVHEIPLDYLNNAKRIICCDGSAETLVQKGYIPAAIVGDLDSISNEICKQFHDRIYKDYDQETNDLTKAVKWCIRNGFPDVVILGATGKREDHTIGNISLLSEYIKEINVVMITDTGIFTPHLETSIISSIPGQQVSIFTIDPRTSITSSGLKHPLNKLKLKNWWNATLNEATGNSFELIFRGGPVIVYRKFME